MRAHLTDAGSSVSGTPAPVDNGPETPGPRGEEAAPEAPLLAGKRYLLVVPIAFQQSPDGRVWLDQLWHQDLIAHLRYIEDLTLLAPCQKLAAPPAPGSGMVEARVPAAFAGRRRLQFRALVPAGGLSHFLPALPRAIAESWRAVGAADIVHSSVAGWPVPPGMIVNPIAWLRRKPLVIVVESAFWRPGDPAVAGAKARLRARINEAFARWSLRHARLGIYTHAGYRDSLPVGPGGQAAVQPASWISEADLLSPAAARLAWEAKPAAPRFLLASRLTPEKGLKVFLEAARQLEDNLARHGGRAEIDVIGEGGLAGEIRALATRCRHLHLRLLAPVPYGAPFMQLMRGYHAAIVPTTGDEQPRIIYDAFAQGVPVLASDTPGNLEVAREGATGRVFRRGDAAALARLLEEMAGQPQQLQRMGLAGLAAARGHTHAAMHAARARLLSETFGSTTAPGPSHDPSHSPSHSPSHGPASGAAAPDPVELPDTLGAARPKLPEKA